jgi:hypothetical protein
MLSTRLGWPQMAKRSKQILQKSRWLKTGREIHLAWLSLKSVSLSLSLSLYGSTVLVYLGRFFSFLIYTQSVGLLGREISPSQGRYLQTEQHKHRINAHRYPCLWVGFEPTIPAFERAKTVHALDRAATVIGGLNNNKPQLHSQADWIGVMLGPKKDEVKWE